MSETAVGTKSRLPKFMQKGRLGGFLTVVLTGQLVYVSFEAFKGSLLIPVTNALGITAPTSVPSWAGSALPCSCTCPPAG